METGKEENKFFQSAHILVFYSVLVEIPAALPLTLSITSTFPLEMSAFTMRLSGYLKQIYKYLYNCLHFVNTHMSVFLCVWCVHLLPMVSIWYQPLLGSQFPSFTDSQCLVKCLCLFALLTKKQCHFDLKVIVFHRFSHRADLQTGIPFIQDKGMCYHFFIPQASMLDMTHTTQDLISPFPNLIDLFTRLFSICSPRESGGRMENAHWKVWGPV